MNDLRRRYAVLRPAEQMIAWSYVLMSLCAGLVLLLGDDLRVSGASYDALRQTPGGVKTWGWAWLSLGVCLLCGQVMSERSSVRHVVKMVGYLGVTIIAWLFSLSFGLSIAMNPAAGLLGVPVFLGVGFMSAAVAASHWALWRLKIVVVPTTTR